MTLNTDQNSPAPLATIRAPLTIGSVTLSGRVFLAPMSGITDLPFRTLAHSLGAPLVVSEMIASKEWVKSHPGMMRKAEGAGLTPFVIQLAGCEAKWMAEGARRAEQMGAQIIDINMGCPAKKVTKGHSGSALMRDLDHALGLIDAVVAAVDLPVSLKMRMGWDHDHLNAPELAGRAEQAGIQMIVVHGRTRCQFFQGKADWHFLSQVKRRVKIPLIANGDILSLEDISKVLTASLADGVMIGRGACGRPWFLKEASDYLKKGMPSPAPSLADQAGYAHQHYQHMLSHYGREQGVKNARKHLGWLIEKANPQPINPAQWRARLCRQDDPHKVQETLALFYLEQEERQAA